VLFIWKNKATCDKRRKSGQILMFMMMVLVILVFMVLWNYDVHRIIHVKSITQNAGDSSALAAARWQGISLNLIGDLNVLNAIALSESNYEASASIDNIRARLCYTGPMIAMVAAQQAAKANNIFRNPDYDSITREHARAVREDYTEISGADGSPLFQEPYTGCWLEYADMIELVADDGVAAGPDNVRYYTDFSGGHYLLNPGFYDAIAGRTWCWFYLNASELLDEYENFFPCWWPGLPVPEHPSYLNSEIFGLDLLKIEARLRTVTDMDALDKVIEDRSLTGTVTDEGASVRANWYCYNMNDGHWSRSWDKIKFTDLGAFPVIGTIKPEYDYNGVDAVVRVSATATRATPGARGSKLQNTVGWLAAAKPFGYLDGPSLPNTYELVLPAFHDVRLIPLDSSSLGAGGGYNLGWRKHIDEHLPVYMDGGPGAIGSNEEMSGCYYCAQLVTRESQSFRKAGSDWLDEYDYLCILPPGGGGGGPGGGTRRGH